MVETIQCFGVETWRLEGLEDSRENEEIVGAVGDDGVRENYEEGGEGAVEQYPEGNIISMVRLEQELAWENTSLSISSILARHWLIV